MTRGECKKLIKDQVKKAAKKMVIKEPEKHSKLNDLVNEDLKIQSNLTDRRFNLKKIIKKL